MPDIRNSRFDRLRFALIRGRNKRDPIFYLQRTLQNPPSTTTTTITTIIDRMNCETLLPPERASLRQPGLPPRRLAQHRRAAAADDDRLRVREDRRDGEAAGAFDVHEEGAWGWHECLWECTTCE